MECNERFLKITINYLTYNFKSCWRSLNYRTTKMSITASKYNLYIFLEITFELIQKIIALALMECVLGIVRQY